MTKIEGEKNDKNEQKMKNTKPSLDLNARILREDLISHLSLCL